MTNYSSDWLYPCRNHLHILTPKAIFINYSAFAHSLSINVNNLSNSKAIIFRVKKKK